MTRFTRWVLRHKLFVLLGWLVVLVAGASTLGLATDSLAGTSSYPGREGYETNEQILRKYGDGGPGNPIVVVITLPVDQSAVDPKINTALAQGYEQLTSKGRRVLSYPQTGDPAFLAADGRSQFGLVFVPYCAHGASRCAGAETKLIESALRQRLPARATLGVTGLDQLSPSADGGGEDEEDSTLIETALAAMGALIVLLIVFGSLFAFLPLIIAAVSILTGFLVVLGLTRFIEVASIVEYVIAFIGLGVAIDYALLFTTRWREERQRGHDSAEAVVRTMQTAGRAVVASGGTVAVGLLLLITVPNPGIRSIAIGGALVPMFGVLVTLTLLPALLATVGDRLDWPRRRSERRPGRLWIRWASLVVRRPRIAVAAALAVLVPLCLAALGLSIGDAASTALPGTGQSRDTLTTLTDAGIPSGVLTPIEVLVPASQDPAGLATAVSDVEGVFTAIAPDAPAWRADGTALVSVLPVDETSTVAGRATIERVREVVHERFPGATVGGSGAAAMDEISALYDAFPYLLAAIALVCMIILTRTFRSPILALQAVVLNLLSVAAAYGALVVIWQYGYGSQLIWGIPALGAIDAMAPLITFAFLFGLSMDFEVFLLSRIREEYAVTGSTRTAVVTGLGRVGRLITSAALILGLSFASLATLPAIPAKVMATGLGVAVLLDATVIRAVLVPALITLTGRWTWWMPTPLARLLRVPAQVVPRK